MAEHKIDFESMEWESLAPGVKCRAYERGGRKLRLVEFGREFVEQDWCRKGHIGYILEGRMEIDFNGEKEVFGVGDGIFIPAGEEHKHKGCVLTDKVKVILVEDA